MIIESRRAAAPTGDEGPCGQARSARLVVLVSGRGSNLQAIHAAIVDGRLDASIEAVVSNRPAAPALEWARRHGVAAVALDHRAHAGREAFDAVLADAVDRFEPDWVVLAGFMRILTSVFIDRFASRLVNIHPSLLPLFPGLDTHRRAIEAGVLLHGATVHHVTANLDAGPIVAQAVVPVHPGDDEDALASRVLAMEHRLYPHALSLLMHQRATGQPPEPATRVLLHPSLVDGAGRGADRQVDR